MPDAQDLKEQLLRTDTEYRELYQLHHELDEQVGPCPPIPTRPRCEQLEKSDSRNVSCSSRIEWKRSSGRYSAPPPSGPSHHFRHA